jgi:hypothetical protein
MDTAEYSCNLSTWVAETGRSQVWDWPGQLSEAVFQKTNNKDHISKDEY